MLKVIAACGSGMGSSQIIKMKISKVFKEKNIDINMTHSSIGEAKTQAGGVDVVFCSMALTNNFEKAKESGTIIVGLKNLLSEQEIRQKIEENVIGKTKTPC